MNNGGDAAEQVVRLSLEGFEVAARLSGSAAKNIALLLVSVLKQEQKTKGKARLTNMIKSGKELKVFSIPQKDLKKFTEQAKRYGVLYCVLRDKNTKGENAPVDIIARAEDASKIQRIVERFELGKVDMDMYIRMYDELKRSEGDNPTIGIVLCSDTDDDIARYSVMHGNEQLFASKYKLYLPTKEELKAEIETQKAMFYLQQQDNEDRNKNYTFNIE